MRFRLTIDVDIATTRKAQAWMRKTVPLIERETHVSCDLPILEPVDEHGEVDDPIDW